MYSWKCCLCASVARYHVMVAFTLTVGVSLHNACDKPTTLQHHYDSFNTLYP